MDSEERYLYKICYLFILHNFCTVYVYHINLLIHIVCFVLRRLRFNGAAVRSLVQEVDRLVCGFKSIY